MTCMKASSEAREALRLSQSVLRSSPTEQRVHGTFSVGNTFVDAEMKNPRFIFDNGAFLGPIEYDVATSLETYVDLIAQRSRQALDSAGLVTFVQRLVSNLERARSLDRRALRALTIYQYVGHLNLFQRLRGKLGKPMLPAAYFWQHMNNFSRTMNELI